MRSDDDSKTTATDVESTSTEAVVEKLRLFIGVRISMATVRELTQLRATLAEQAPADLAARWVEPASYHITLKYLGWCRPEVVTALRDCVAKALVGRARFSLRVQGGGGFPVADGARVLWAGIGHGAEELSKLAAVIDSATTELGFPAAAADTWPFRPHVTLARFKEVADVSTLLLAWTEQNFSETSVESVILFESAMKSNGFEHTEVASWPLEASSKHAKRQTSPVEQSLPDRH